MKRLFRLVFRLIAGLLVVAALLIAFRNPIARLYLEHQIRQETGLEAILGRVTLGLKSPVIRIQNLRLVNPANLGGGTFVDLPVLELEYDRVALFFRNVRLRFVGLRITEVHVIEDAEGVTNFERMARRLQERESGKWVERWGLDYEGIDTLDISFERFRYTSLRDRRRNQDVRIGAKSVVVRDVRSGADLVRVVGQILSQRGVGLLLDYALNNLFPSASNRPPSSAAVNTTVPTNAIVPATTTP